MQDIDVDVVVGAGGVGLCGCEHHASALSLHSAQLSALFFLLAFCCGPGMTEIEHSY